MPQDRPIIKIKFSDLMPGKFSAKQLEATNAAKTHDYVLYGGAMGGGKSYWLRWFLPYYLNDLWQKTKHLEESKQVKNVMAGLFCEDYPSLNDRHLTKIQYEFSPKMGQWDGKMHGWKMSPSMGGGFIAFRNLNDPSKYQSAEFGIIAIDELTKNPKEVFDFLRTRKRWPGITRTKFIAGSNPGGVGHGWVKGMWMDGTFEPGEREQDQFAFVKATAYDNPYLTQEYYDSLEGLPNDLRRAFLEGDWDIFKGQFFTEWRNDVHVREPFAIPNTFRRFLGIDFGSTNPFAAYWIAVDWDGNYWVYREYYKAGETAENNAKNILRMMPGDERVEMAVADRAVFHKQGYGETIADILRRNGIGQPGTKIPMLEPSTGGKQTRVSRAQMLKQKLYWDNHTQPKIHFFSTCKNAIRTIPTLVYDENKPEDVDTNGEDHCLVGETPILTEKGWLPIGQIGYATRRNAEVLTLETEDGYEISCTPDHRILTPFGWKEAQSLRPHDEVLWSLAQPSNRSMENVSTDADRISAMRAKGSKVLVSSIGSFGNKISDQYPKDFTSITKTTTAQITGLKTLFSSPLFPTLRITLPDPLTDNEPHGEQMHSALVVRVIENSLRNSEVKRLARVTPAGKRSFVYDLGIRHRFHGFIAAGFIVHNSYDAITYVLQKLEDVRTIQPLTRIEQKLEAIRQAHDFTRPEAVFNQRFNKEV